MSSPIIFLFFGKTTLSRGNNDREVNSKGVTKWITIVQKCWHNVMLVRGRVNDYLYPAMPIFSRRYL